MKVEQIKIADLKFSEYNPRTMTEKEVKDLKESLKRFGFVEPIVVNKAPARFNVIIGGHQRVRVAKEFLKIEEVPVVYVDIADLKKEQELNLRLNKNIGRWDWDLLANIDEAVLLESGFLKDELNIQFDVVDNIQDGIFLKSVVGKTGQFQITILIDKQYEEAVRSYIKKKGKKELINKIIEICQSAEAK